MNRISIIITLSGLVLGAPVSSQATDYYLVAATGTTLSAEYSPDNIIAVWSDDKLCNRFSAKKTSATEYVHVVKHKKSSIAPRMSRNMNK